MSIFEVNVITGDVSEKEYTHQEIVANAVALEEAEKDKMDNFTITTRQFLIQAAIDGHITQAEAIASSKMRNVPASIASIFAVLPQDQQFVAQVTWGVMTIVERSSALTAAVGAGLGLSEEELDQFFINASLV